MTKDTKALREALTAHYPTGEWMQPCGNHVLCCSCNENLWGVDRDACKAAWRMHVIEALATPASDVAPVAWMSIPGWPYEVSNAGDVRSVASGKLLSAFLVGSGYPRVHLHKNGERLQVYVHRLVAEAFCAGFGTEVNHKNGFKTDNRSINLEWVTRSENEQHSRYRLGNLCARVIATPVGGGEEIVFPSIESVRGFGFTPSGVYKCCHGKRDIHKGHKWRFADTAVAHPPAHPVDPVGGEALREVAAKYADMGIDERAEAMADNCDGDPWELIGYFREKLRQSQARVDAANNAATGFAKKLAAQPS